VAAAALALLAAALLRRRHLGVLLLLLRLPPPPLLLPPLALLLLLRAPRVLRAPRRGHGLVAAKEMVVEAEEARVVDLLAPVLRPDAQQRRELVLEDGGQSGNTGRVAGEVEAKVAVREHGVREGLPPGKGLAQTGREGAAMGEGEREGRVKKGTNAWE